MRDEAQDYSRALAFRRASCTLKSLSYKVSDVKQIDGLRNIGQHMKRVLNVSLLIVLIRKGVLIQYYPDLLAKWLENAVSFMKIS